MSILTIDLLNKTYPGVQALKDVSFAINAGEVHALVGENGAGKSTLIKILAGAEDADSGKMVYGGQNYVPMTPKDALKVGISTIYQVPNLMPERSIAHNILLGREPRGRFGLLDLHMMNDQARKILAQLNASHLSPQTNVEQLKVGEKQIVEIAKALLNDSRLLIMDEPTSALNQVESETLFSLIEILRQRGVTILYVSHRLEEIFRLADTVTVMRDGMHIVTQPVSSLTKDQLVEQMIGRKLESAFPPRAERKSQDAILTVEHLNVQDRLFDINFQLYRGEVLAVAGLSGCGKTELAKALFGDLRITGGKLTLQGVSYQPSPQNAIRNRMMYLPEDRKAEGVIQEMTVKRNVTLGILDRFSNTIGLMNLKREQSIAEEQVRALDIRTPSLNQMVLNLSGGNQQKVALAKCLTIDPEILIFVEPTQGIDVGVKFEIYQFIVDQIQAGRAVLLISSETSEILGLSHRVLVMRDGRIVAELNTETSTQEEILRYALGQSTTQIIE